MSEESIQLAECYDMNYHLVTEILGVPKQKDECEGRIERTAFEDDIDMTWEPLPDILDDTTALLKEFLYTPGDGNLSKKFSANIIN